MKYIFCYIFLIQIKFFNEILMKIAFCTEYLHPQINGIAVRCHEMIQNFRKLGCNVTVYGPKAHIFTQIPIHTVTNPFNKKNRLALLPNFKLLINIFLKKYDVVHIVLPLFAWFPLIIFICKLSKTKVILSNHVNLTYYSNSYLKNKILIQISHWLIKRFYQFQNQYSDLILAPSIYDEIERFISKNKYQILKSGINTKLFYPKLKLKPNKRIIYVGRVSPEKNLNALIELFLLLPQDYSLSIIGDGPSLSELKEKYNKNQRVQFLGFIDHFQLAEYYHQADFHLVTSLSETFGFTIVESMACGTPVLYPKCNVFSSLYEKDFPDLMYDINNPNSFLKAVGYLEKNLTQLSNRCIEYAKNHSWENVSQSILQLYQSHTNTIPCNIQNPKKISYRFPIPFKQISIRQNLKV